MRFAFLALPIALLTLAPSSFAALHDFQANLDGLQVSPPNASPAFGLLDVTLDDSTGLVTVVTGTYQDLLGNSVSVNFHGLAGAGTNAGVLFALTLDAPGSTTGTFSGNGTLNPTNVAGMLAGQTYVDVRSNVFPSGEIRGQLLETPEPASLSLLALAAAPLLARRRRA